MKQAEPVADVTRNTHNYFAQGGNELVIGGKLTFLPGAIIEGGDDLFGQSEPASQIAYIADSEATTIAALKDELRIGVMEADIDSDVDAKTIADAGVKSIQLHTGGMCHLDASMTEQGLKEISTKDLDLVVLENVGNLVCPAEFDTGAVKNAMILSVPEGHDKPLKYPLIFTVCDALIINKIDVLPYFDFDMEKVVEYAHMRNPKLKIFPLSAKTGEGVDAWCNWLREQVRAWNG